MSEELKDIRSKVSSKTLAVLQSIADSHNKTLNDFIRELLTDKAERFLVAARLADRRLRVEGDSGILGDNRK